MSAGPDPGSTGVGLRILGQVVRAYWPHLTLVAIMLLFALLRLLGAPVPSWLVWLPPVILLGLVGTQCMVWWALVRRAEGRDEWVRHEDGREVRLEGGAELEVVALPRGPDGQVDVEAAIRQVSRDFRLLRWLPGGRRTVVWLEAELREGLRRLEGGDPG